MEVTAEGKETARKAFSFFPPPPIHAFQATYPPIRFGGFFRPVDRTGKEKRSDADYCDPGNCGREMGNEPAKAERNEPRQKERGERDICAKGRFFFANSRPCYYKHPSA